MYLLNLPPCVASRSRRTPVHAQEIMRRALGRGGCGNEWSQNHGTRLRYWLELPVSTRNMEVLAADAMRIAKLPPSKQQRTKEVVGALGALASASKKTSGGGAAKQSPANQQPPPGPTPDQLVAKLVGEPLLKVLLVRIVCVWLWLWLWACVAVSIMAHCVAPCCNTTDMVLGVRAMSPAVVAAHCHRSPVHNAHHGCGAGDGEDAGGGGPECHDQSPAARLPAPAGTGCVEADPGVAMRPIRTLFPWWFVVCRR